MASAAASSRTRQTQRRSGAEGRVDMSLRRVAAHLALVLAPLAILLGLAEAAVRATRAHESCVNRFSGAPIWVCDPILQFKLDPELDVLGQKLSRDGFRTHELAAKRPGVYRILALGDSCTFGQLQRGDRYGYVSQSLPDRAREAARGARRTGPLRGLQRGDSRLQQLPGPDVAAREAAGPRPRSDHRALRLERSLPVRGAAGAGSVPGARQPAPDRGRGSRAAYGALPVLASARLPSCASGGARPRTPCSRRS